MLCFDASWNDVESEPSGVILDPIQNPGAPNNGGLDPSFRWGDMQTVGVSFWTLPWTRSRVDPESRGRGGTSSQT